VSHDGIQITALLDATSGRIAELLAGSEPPVRMYLAEVGKSRGKMLRPRLLITVSELFGGANTASVANCAACSELLHIATLIHDDIIDEANTRRGNVTLNSRFGNEVAVIVGDYLLAIVFRALLREKDVQLMDLVLNTTQELGLGELHEVLNRNNFELTTEHYYRVIDLKTAALFALCSGLGAFLGGADEAAVKLAARYGRTLGCGFQIVDDLLDITADEDATGKPSFNDLSEGRVTLPVIDALGLKGQRTRELIEAAQRDGTRASRRAVRRHLAELGSLTRTRTAAVDYLAQANELGRELAGLAAAPQIAEELELIEEKVISALPPLTEQVVG